MFKCFTSKKVKIKKVQNIIDLKTSIQGKTFIKHYESCRLKAYRCSANKLTIGWGHVIKESDDLEITLAKAQRFFDSDIKQAERSIELLVDLGVKLTQGQYDALVSLIFNVGHGNLAKSRLLKNINNQKKVSQEDWFKSIKKEWDFYYATKNGKKIKLKGLVARRKAELAMFDT